MFRYWRGSFITPVFLAHVPDPPSSSHDLVGVGGWPQQRSWGLGPSQFCSCRRLWRFRPIHPTCHWLNRPPRSCLFPRDRPSFLRISLRIGRSKALGPGFWAFRLESRVRIADRYCLGLWPLPGFQTRDGNSPFNRANHSARWPGLVTLASRQPPGNRFRSASAPELGRLSARSSACCRGLTPRSVRARNCGLDRLPA